MCEVSVVIGTYNQANYLTKAIESALNQTFQDLEIIVVDDGSQDETKEIVLSYAKRYTNKVKYFYQQNMGGPSAKNRGVKASKGEYIAFLDSDDIWFPQKIKRQLSMIKKKFQYSMICCDLQKRYKDKVMNKSFLTEVAHFEKREEIDLEELLKRNFIFPSSVLIKKKCFDEGMLYFDEKLIGNDDYDMWLRVVQKFRIGFVNEILWIKVSHETNLSKNLDRQLKGEIVVFKKFLCTCKNKHYKKIALKRIKNITFNLAYYYFENLRKRVALWYFCKSLKHGKHTLKALVYIIFLLLPDFILKSARKIKKRLNFRTILNYNIL